MSRRPARITQAEIERAIRAARKAGVAVVEVKIGDDGRRCSRAGAVSPLRDLSMQSFPDSALPMVP
jgi:hypothetical protein